MKVKIQAFIDLEVWRKSHQFALKIYVITKTFPRDELFGLTSQMRRAGVSITSNIAEGFSRFSAKEKQQFYNISLGSLHEIQSQLFLSKDLGYVSDQDFKILYEQSIDIQKMLRKFMQSCISFIRNT